MCDISGGRHTIQIHCVTRSSRVPILLHLFWEYNRCDNRRRDEEESVEEEDALVLYMDQSDGTGFTTCEL
jgi:hypothetical protein